MIALKVKEFLKKGIKTNQGLGVMKMTRISSKGRKNKLKHTIQQSNMLLRIYYWLKPPRPDQHNHLILHYARTKGKQEVTFVQLGAHRGGLHDPLDRHIRLDGWKGLFVEPQIDELNALKQHYRDFAGLHYAPVAIDPYETTKSFFTIKPAPGLPKWVSQLSSFYAAVPGAIQDQFPQVEIEVQQVKCASLDELLITYSIKKVDVLLLDTEGHDGVIIQTLNFASISPDLILFEHYHLSDVDYQQSLQHLQRAGYSCWAQSANTLAVHSQALPGAYEEVWMNPVP